MAKTIVNKHYDSVELINKYQREVFHENDEYAKGEIIIINSEEPSIWVLDKNNNPTQISGSNNSSIDETVINDLKDEIVSGYTAADSAITAAYQKADNSLRTDFKNANDEIVKDLTLKINAVQLDYKAKDTEITSSIQALESDILGHTINGMTLSSNPVIDATNVSVGNYSELVLTDENFENVTSLDNTQIAIKKVENMVVANALAMAASLNDINRRTRLEVNEVEMAEDEYLRIDNEKFNVFTTPIVSLKAKIEGVDENTPINCELMVTLDNVSDLTFEFPETIKFMNDIEFTNGTYIFKFKYNYVEVIKLKTI